MQDLLKTKRNLLKQNARFFYSKTQGSTKAKRKVLLKQNARSEKKKEEDVKNFLERERCEQCKGPLYTKDCPLKEEGKIVEEAYYTQFGAPFQEGGYRAIATFNSPDDPSSLLQRCEQCKGPLYTKDCPPKEEGKTVEEAYYTQFGAPFQEGGYRAIALGFYQRNNVNPSCQE
nr:hypothetical protein [Tanacetum cinerariifolium]